MSAEQNKYILQTVHNAMKILRLYSKDKQELSLHEIAETLALNKTTAYRLVSTLANYGYLEKKFRNGGYQLGVKALRNSGIIKSHWKTYREEIKPVLSNLAKECQKTVHFGVLEGRNIVYLEKFEYEEDVQLSSYIGSSTPAYCTASGLVILAYSKKQALSNVLPTSFEQFGPNTVATLEQLEERLQKIRKQGYYVGIEETHEGVISIAAPVRDFSNDIVGAISMVLNANNSWSMEQIKSYVSQIKIAAEQLSAQLGFVNH